MILDPKKDYSVSMSPTDLAEFEAKAISMIYPSLRRQVWGDPRLHLGYTVPSQGISVSLELPKSIVEEFIDSLRGCFDWRCKALAEHGDEHDYLVMYRYMGVVRLINRGAGQPVQQLLEFGVEKGGTFALRLAKSEPGEPDYTSYLSVTYPDYEVEGLYKQLDFVLSVMDDGEDFKCI